MHQSQKIIAWFNEVTKKDIPLVGGKGANLGEMTNANIPVPPGFIVTADAYFDFLQQAELTDKLRKLLEPVDVNNSKQLQHVAAQVRQAISNAAMPPEIAAEIRKAYIKMGKGLVAVRSSATAKTCPRPHSPASSAPFLTSKVRMR